jgi:hypothetical protein
MTSDQNPTTSRISHQQVREAARRLISGAFRRDGEYLHPENRPRFSIPAASDQDDDLVLMDYIRQQEKKTMGDSNTTNVRDEDFVAHVTELYEIAKRCAEETIYRANLRPEDRNIILRSVIKRLQDATNDAK